ncbi:MAG TPA: hypothetical protein DFI00_06170 [Rhodospirillaceae bacterium]|nr:hypothetical protein [Alphaproteobacteria bacterium]OUT41959.1 MAG: hypothetical protein CBB62_06530 [Micavibrio sp. TMED2]HCI46860.1 hypothetical protein [Rhodospirillaceae bacterium]MAS46445.1 hypothetical protein [Alphaproteobacteria bacterium]MAX94540.1 hypothetical protein [Alphaproteobacteria bacterium]|tara:strand:- start:11718 stop:12305 length:588 start_codon:yes stop_codon:yes gene_type:complete
MPADKDLHLDFQDVDKYSDEAVEADVQIFRNTFVSASAANKLANPLVAGERFVGISAAPSDNTGGSAAAKRVKMRRYGLVTLPIAGVTAADRHKAVYASDDQTATLTATGNSYIGQIEEVPAAGYAVVWFDISRTVAGAPALTDLTGTLTGTADGELADAGDTSNADQSAVINKNFKEIQASIAAINALLNARLA